MRKVDNEITQLCRLILADILDDIKAEKGYAHPRSVLMANTLEALHEVGYKDNGKTLKSLQETYDSYNDGTLEGVCIKSE